MKDCEDEAVERTETFDFFLIGELKGVTENETFDAFLVGVEENALLTLECFLFPRYDVLDFTDRNSVCADFKFWTFTQEAAHFSQMKSLFSGVIGSFKVFSNILRKDNAGILDTESIDFLL